MIDLRAKVPSRPSTPTPAAPHAPGAVAAIASDDPDAIAALLNDLLGVEAGPDDSGPSSAPTPSPDAPSGDRFPVEGSGEPDDPYRASWEALVAARETYQPRKGRTDIPEWVQQLDGKIVRLSGYLLLPVMQQNTEEVLLMRNQWDGCCIGVPPTPYDAIEVKLSQATKELGRSPFNYGTITGRLKVDPYLVKNWLVGLYIIEDAALEVTGF